MVEWVNSIPADCLKQLLVLLVILATPLYGWHRRLVSVERKGREKAEEKLESARLEYLRKTEDELSRLRAMRSG